ncbi:MAG: site-specific DNA-methyltransferase [Prevotella sp.]|nr:site-specific DNA-methyltransferase [Prevotella sp.]
METYKDHITLSPDLNEERLQTLRKLFPDWFTQKGRLDINEVKKAAGTPDTETERYEFRWFGKSAAKRNAFTPTRATLHYDPARSVNADKTENIIIEGENLEVLKILQQGYREKVKCIYIDPPYNTGEDFLYNDDFKEGKEAYWESTGVKKDGIALDTNTVNDGRFHSNWLDMIYPRLLVARTLLRPDGVIFISMDDHEIHHLRKICDEIFGEENFVAQFIWEKRLNRENRVEVSIRHDYILCYAKESQKDVRRIAQLPMNEKALANYSNPDNDPRGLWKSDPAHAQAGHGTKSQFYTLVAPNGKKHDLPSGRCWVYNQNVMEEKIRDNRIWFGKDGNAVPRIKTFLDEKERGLTPESIIFAKDGSTNENAKENLKTLFDGVAVFDTPKPIELISYLLSLCKGGGIVLDFFAGSGVTAHAAMQTNLYRSKENQFQFVCVQIPEITQKDSVPYNAGLKTISEITIERTKRACKIVKEEADAKIKEEKEKLSFDDEEPVYMPDLGFKVFTLSKSSFPRVDFAPDPEKTDEENLQLLQEYIAQKERQLTIQFNAEELITEILIKQGFQLTYKLEPQPQFEANHVYLATDATHKAYITVDNKLNDATVEYFLAHTDTKFICIERALDTTKKYNLKRAMDSKFFAF